jgi:hypothetical protein
MDGHCFLLRNILTKIEMSIHYVRLPARLGKLAWMTLVAEIARRGDEAGKK